MGTFFGNMRHRSNTNPMGMVARFYQSSLRGFSSSICQARIQRDRSCMRLCIFRSLGFVKPEDWAVRILSSSQPSRCGVSMSMGPKGLTRLGMQLSELHNNIAQDLATNLGSLYRTQAIERISDIL